MKIVFKYIQSSLTIGTTQNHKRFPWKWWIPSASMIVFNCSIDLEICISQSVTFNNYTASTENIIYRILLVWMVKNGVDMESGSIIAMLFLKDCKIPRIISVRTAGGNWDFVNSIMNFLFI